MLEEVGRICLVGDVNFLRMFASSLSILLDSSSLLLAFLNSEMKFCNPLACDDILN